jgi:hypothetical protein
VSVLGEKMRQAFEARELLAKPKDEKALLKEYKAVEILPPKPLETTPDEDYYITGETSTEVMEDYYADLALEWETKPQRNARPRTP